MSQTATREERQSRLDQFASEGPLIAGNQSVATIEHNSGLPAVFGAQAVAVYRDEARVLAKLKVLAAAAGDDWYYRFPVKDKGKTSWIEGPSIKLANDLARLYGNCEVDCRAQDLGSVVLFHARFVDLETGFALTRPFQQRKGASKLGGSDEGRREDITFQIGASKAIRNVVVNALQTFADFAFTEAKEAFVDKIGKDVEKWRRITVERIAAAQIDIKRVEAAMGRQVKDWIAPDIARVIAMGKAVTDGMATWDETFPPLASYPGEKINKAAEKLDAFADEKSMVNQGGAAGPSAGSAKTAAGAGTAQAAVDPDNPHLAIADRLLSVATGPENLSERLERLDFAMQDLIEEEPGNEKFIKEAAQVAGKVAKEEMTVAVARDWLKEQGK